MPEMYEFAIYEVPYHVGTDLGTSTPCTFNTMKLVVKKDKNSYILLGHRGKIYICELLQEYRLLTYDSERQKIAQGRAELVLKNLDNSSVTRLFTHNPYKEVVERVGEVTSINTVEYYK